MSSFAPHGRSSPWSLFCDGPGMSKLIFMNSPWVQDLRLQIVPIFPFKRDLSLSPLVANKTHFLMLRYKRLLPVCSPVKMFVKLSAISMLRSNINGKKKKCLYPRVCGNPSWSTNTPQSRYVIKRSSVNLKTGTYALIVEIHPRTQVCNYIHD